MECVVLVILEMCLSFAGIVCNLLIVATVRQDETLRASTLNFLLFNLCFSNLLIAFLVKPISAIYVGYAISTGEWQVSLAFCTLYTFTYRTTWCIFPFTLIAMCWAKLLAQCRCGRCGILCCARNKNKQLKAKQMRDMPLNVRSSDNSSLQRNHLDNQTCDSTSEQLVAHQHLRRHRLEARDSTPTPSTTTDLYLDQVAGENGAISNIEGFKPVNKVVRTIEDGPTARQKFLVCFIWVMSALFGAATCFPDKVFGVGLSEQIKNTQEASMAPPTNEPSKQDISYCTVKTGVNDLLDYISLAVALVIPLIVGPCVVGIFQVRAQVTY